MPSKPAPRVLRYDVVKELVLSLIIDQNLQPGDKLPSSAELAKMADVSLISVRRALDELERAGRIQRHQGVGTFVSQSRIVSQPAHKGALLATLSGGGSNTSLQTELLRLQVGRPSAAIAQALNIDEGQPVWEVVRGRKVAGQPAILERAILPLSLVPSLDERYLAGGGSLYTYLEDKYGISDHSEEQYLEVAMPDDLEARWLNLPTRESVVKVKGVSVSTDSVPFDCFQQTYPAKKFVFYVSGFNSHQLLSAPGTEVWNITPLAGN